MKIINLKTNILLGGLLLFTVSSRPALADYADDFQQRQQERQEQQEADRIDQEAREWNETVQKQYDSATNNYTTQSSGSSSSSSPLLGVIALGLALGVLKGVVQIASKSKW